MNQQDRPSTGDLYRPGRPPSIAPSISSILSNATTITAPIHVQRGFKSREEYLAALNDFAESKLYMPTGNHTLHGWYGGKTMDDYKNRPGLREGKKKRKKKEAVAGIDTGDGAIAVVPEEFVEGTDAERRGSEEGGGPVGNEVQKEGRLRRLSRVFAGGSGRRATVA